ncbi:hypothetical protein Taro_047665 [Colocasia esculenta]|uniref:Uncharacterized protein n=1 Tax=Colocasia esculenta TaxID=4460 RepID=A0A843X5P1_COLES|nr:hypothetical protein [Colocasia esculenta]
MMDRFLPAAQAMTAGSPQLAARKPPVPNRDPARHALYYSYFKKKYKDNVHNDGEVMRGTMNVITRLARTMNERLDAMAEVERYKMKLGIYGGYDMRSAAQRLKTHSM